MFISNLMQDFMVKVLGMIPAEDSAPGNAQQCPAGSSGAKSPWYITMQRGETVGSKVVTGTCTLFYGPTEAVQADGEGLNAAMWRPAEPGQDCVYSSAPEAAALRPFYSDSPTPVKVPSRTPDTCCKSCAADPLCVSAAFAPPPSQLPPRHPGPGPQPGECFGYYN